MNWINIPCNPAQLAALLLLLGSGMAATAAPVAVPQDKTIAAASSQTQPVVDTEIIRLAWDRVGTQA